MKKKLHLICNAHIDPVWLWRWNEGAAEALSTFRVAAEFCERYDGFVFNHNEALLYRWIEEYEPALFERIARLVRAGKWHIMGGWFLQPDCNMPAGESLVRQILAGKSYFKEKFGTDNRTAVNFDSFGHSRGLVQILAKSGFDSYIVCRPSPESCDTQSDDFHWIGFDGSVITVHRSDENYNSIRGQVDKKLSDWLSEAGDRQTGCFLWGIGDHGGGPSKKDLEKLQKAMESNEEWHMVHSVSEDYFADLYMNSKPLPSFDRSLQPVAQGCYTSQIRIKQKHRKLENELYSAEKMLCHAALAGLLKYPLNEMRRAQDDLLFSEFHDALPGSAIKSVEEDTLQLLSHGLEIIERMKAKAFFALCTGQRPVTDGETPVLVYNPHPFPVKGIFECELVLPSQNWNNEFTCPVLYRNGEKIPSQPEQEESHFNMDWRKRIVFCTELLPFSMNRFDCRFEIFASKPKPKEKEENGFIRFCNDQLMIIINCETGLVDRYAVNGKDYLKAGSFSPVVLKDGYNSWGSNGKSGNIEAFTLMTPEESADFSATDTETLPPVRVIEDGPVRTVVEAVFRYKHSSLCQQYFLPKQGTELQVKTIVYWNEKDKMLKLSVPTCLENGEYVGQTAFGTDSLKNDGSECVSQKWCAIFSQDKRSVFLCTNDGTYGSDCKNGRLRPTLLRSPAYAAADFVCGKAIPSDRLTFRMEQGERIYNFWFDAGLAEEKLRHADRMALVHNELPYALSYCPSGQGKPLDTLLKITTPEVILSALKPAENQKGYIIRLYNSSDKATKTDLIFPLLQKQYTVSMKENEVKTLRLDTEAAILEENNLLENPPTDSV